MRWKWMLCLLLISMSHGIRAATTDVVVMCFNIHHGTDGAGKDTLDEMGEFIQNEKPDFVGLQEVDQGCTRSGSVMQMQRLAELTGMQPAFAAHFPYQGGEYGNGLLSRHPLTDVKNHRLTLLKKDGTTETRSLLAATATLPGGTTVTVATAHFALDQPSRLKQAEETVNMLGGKQHPVIFMGDLNCTPETPEIGKLTAAQFVDCDPRHLPTFPVPKATKKIDYIFVNGESGAAPLEARVPACLLSDHFPVVARVRLK